MAEPEHFGRSISIQIGKIKFDEKENSIFNPDKVGYYIYLNNYLKTIIKPHTNNIEYRSIKIEVSAK